MRVLVLLMFAASLTLGLQRWVGKLTVYDRDTRAFREAAHQALLTNVPIGGRSWDRLGMNGTNVRVGVPFLAEALHRITGLSVTRVYALIDTVALAASVILLCLFLRPLGDVYAVIGILLYAAVLPLTYVLFVFHPWDRTSLVGWIAAAWLVRGGRWKLLAGALPVMVAVKYDIVVLPGLYFLAHASSRTWPRVLLRTLTLSIVSLGSFAVLLLARPGGWDRSVPSQFAINAKTFRTLWAAYPPALVFAIPIVLGCMGFRHAEPFARAAFVFSLALFVPWFAITNVAEVRAEMPAFVLMLPCALTGLRLLLSPPPAAD